METPLISSQALPTGTGLEESIVERVLGSGGFGITYLARDLRLDRNVVIKENLPSMFAFRDPRSLTVAPRHAAGEDAESFAWSMESFSKEAAMLASLDHPGIVKVFRSFEAYGTAYFVMPYVEGMPLDELARSKKQEQIPFHEVELHGMLEHLLDALGYLHDRGIYHRDIKPANILIARRGMPVLIDFGAARQRLSERSMTVIESAGYTPFEQLQSRGNVGPWSDLYAVAGTLARIITGETPPKANDRAFDDPWVPLAQRGSLAQQYSASFLEAADRAFTARPQDRWQTAGEWIAQIGAQANGMAQSLKEKELRPVAAFQVPPKISEARLSAGTERAFSISDEIFMRFCWIPPGSFLMGSPANEVGREPEEVLHPVNITKGFWYAKFPCTQGQWFAIRGDRPSHFCKPSMIKQLFNPAANETMNWRDLPVESVNWWEICGNGANSIGILDRIQRWAPAGWRFNLPTEAQWEYACRAGTTSALNHGKPLTSETGRCTHLNEVAWYEDNSDRRTHEVGGKLANAWGLHDMHGSVWEWCLDWHGPYPTHAAMDPEGPGAGSLRVARGGAWNYLAANCRSADRGKASPGIGNPNLGFRLVLVSADR